MHNHSVRMAVNDILLALDAVPKFHMFQPMYSCTTKCASNTIQVTLSADTTRAEPYFEPFTIHAIKALCAIDTPVKQDNSCYMHRFWFTDTARNRQLITRAFLTCLVPHKLVSVYTWTSTTNVCDDFPFCSAACKSRLHPHVAKYILCTCHPAAGPEWEYPSIMCSND